MSDKPRTGELIVFKASGDESVVPGIELEPVLDLLERIAFECEGSGPLDEAADLLREHGRLRDGR